MLLIRVHGSTAAISSSIEVHCSELRSDDCTIDEFLNITSSSTLNFVQAERWNETIHVRNRQGSGAYLLPRGIFQNFRKLEKLEWSTGLLSVNKDSFKDADQLKILNLDDNQIQTLTENVFEHSRSLQEVHLSKNNINLIEDSAFSGLSELQYISLNQNSLTLIKNNTFAGIENLTKLEVNFNLIETIEDGALNLPNLQCINLAHNRLRSLPDNVFVGAPSLSVVSVSYNYLSRIGRIFYNLKNLEELDLGANEIRDIKLNEFAKLPKLAALRLRSSGFTFNNLGEWPNETSTITHLDLAMNELSDSNILDRLQPLANLEKIHLEENDFCEIKGIIDIKEKFPRLRVLGLTANPFDREKFQRYVENLKGLKVYLPSDENNTV